MTTSKRDQDALLALLDKDAQLSMIGLFGPTASRARLLDEVLAPAHGERIRTPQHRKLIAARLDASAMPTYVLAWQHLVFKVLDTLHEPALPADRNTVNALRSELLRITRMDPNDPNTSAATVDFARKFRQSFRALVVNVATLANAIFVPTLEHLERAGAEQAAQLLESARFFLAAPGSVVVLSADEPKLIEHLGRSAPEADGKAILRGWMTGRVDVGSAATTPAAAAAALPNPSVAAPAVATAAVATMTATAARARVPEPSPVQGIPRDTMIKEVPPAPAAHIGAPTAIKASAGVEDGRETSGSVSGAGEANWQPLLLGFGVAGAVFLADRLTKTFVAPAAAQAGVGKTVPILGNLLQLDYAVAAPATFFGNAFVILLELIGLALATILLIFGNDKGYRPKTSIVGYGLVIGGLFANLWDRLTHGSLTNYIRIGDLPVFNLAHVALVVGVILLVVGLLRKPAESDRRAAAQSAA